MGCLNSNKGFNHWFGNIHLSGPCNRKCYFCIGQHMMALDPLNNLNTWPLKNIDQFVAICLKHDVTDVNVTGTNTDPLLYQYVHELKLFLSEHIPKLTFGLRTNGVLALQRTDLWHAFDKASITICSLNTDIHRTMMGAGKPADIERIIALDPAKPVKVNIVLGPENFDLDVINTILILVKLGIKTVNIREPYRQPHVGNPFRYCNPDGHVLGMPYYMINGMKVTYWDVHYVEVESVNLYASGKVSVTYPISKGHCDETGKVLDQNNFKHGRQQEQWL